MNQLFTSKKNLQKEWKSKTIDYAQAINAFVEKGMTEGWEKAGKEPQEPSREKCVKALLQAIREANIKGEFETLREDWPLAHAPLIPLLEEQSQSIPTICLLNDGTIVARIGTNYQDGHVIKIEGTKVTLVPEVDLFGRSSCRQYFAYTTEAGIRITKGWLGEQTALCTYPTGKEGVPETFDVAGFDRPTAPSRLIPFPDGTRVLYVCEDGIFVLEETKAVRLLPTKEQITEHFDWLSEEYPDDELSMNLSMEHGAVSPDGKFIAVGSQDSSHLIFNDKYELVGDIGNMSEYPHYALFSNDGSVVALNSCHFYNGITIGINTSLLTGIKTNAYEENEKTIVLEEMSRVYAGASREGEMIIGNANGYIRAFGLDGERKWEHHIGSSVGDIDISEDGKTLICSTYAGFLSILSLDTKNRAPYEIGSGPHHEWRRWIFWKNQKPLIW